MESHPAPLAMSADPTLAPQALAIEQVLQETMTAMTPVAGSHRGRPRILPSFCLWAGLLVCVLRGWTSQQALWRLLASGHFWTYPAYAISDQAVYKRLAEGSLVPLATFFQQLSQILASRVARWADPTLAAFATAVYVLDEAKLDQMARLLPCLREVPSGDAALLPGTLAGLFNVRLQQWQRLEHHPDPHQNEKLAARRMLDDLPPWCLLLIDLGYFGFAWLDWLTDHQFYWLSRLRAGTSYVVLHDYYHNGAIRDSLVWLGAHRSDRAAHAVRLVQFPVGETLVRYVTNVRDPALFPLPEIARVYARRWDIELAIRLVKRDLKLHLLWSAKLKVILHQVWAVLCIAQIVQAIRLEIAGRAEVDPFDVSMALLLQYLPQYAAAGHDPIATFVADGRTLGFIRPSSRLVVQAPTIPLTQVAPRPPTLVLVREPRYAQRRCPVHAPPPASLTLHGAVPPPHGMPSG